MEKPLAAEAVVVARRANILDSAETLKQRMIIGENHRINIETTGVRATALDFLNTWLAQGQLIRAS